MLKFIEKYYLQYCKKYSFGNKYTKLLYARYSMEFETFVDVSSGREIRPPLFSTNVFYQKNIVLEVS